MRSVSRPALLAACLLALSGTPSFAAAPQRLVSLDQGIDRATLRRYHHTDQGTRLVPAAWLAALERADGRGRFMANDNLRRFGFDIDPSGRTPLNPYGWPIGLTVSDAKASGPIPMAGFTCALCHTGELDYRGTAIRIEGGQAMIDLPAFITSLSRAFAATAADPVRRRRFFAAAIAAGYPAGRMGPDFKAAAARLAQMAAPVSGGGIVQLDTGRGRLDAVQGIANQVFATDLMVPANARNLDAPVSFPYLWDIWRLSWLQYNAFLPPQALSRNIGEVLGSKGVTHFVDPKTGALNPEPLRWQTSIQLDNLLWMEKTLQSLRAPRWPTQVLGPIDQTRAARGRQLFGALCAGCHGIHRLPDGNWDVSVIALDHIGTDPAQATHWAARTYDASRLGLSRQTPTFELSVAVNAIRKQLYSDGHTPPTQQEPDVAFEAPCGYKARPLIGVWATPPFLHNGSVRTIFDLLSDARPSRFRYGSLEYDPVHLGYTEDRAPDSRILDTSVPGNLDGGHWFTNDRSRAGRIGPRLTAGEKYAIIEYLKAATYENYPTAPQAREAAMPCQNDKRWALGQP